MNRLFVFFFTMLCLQNSISISTAQSSELEVISYNTALARALGNDFRPCVRQRLMAMGRNVFKTSDVPTIFLLQEVFYTDAYKSLERWAYENKFYISASNAQRNGLVILSQLPIQNETLHKYSCTRTMQKQGALVARVELNGKTIDLLTSHTKDSDAREPNTCQITQLNELGGFFNASSSADVTIMSGDLNTGPDLKIVNQKYDAIAKLWTPFRNLIQNGWRAPTEKKGITWDFRKNLLAKDGPQDNSTLDHIFFKGSAELTDYGILYDQPVDVNDCKDYEVSPGKTYMSDHYGIRARFKL